MKYSILIYESAEEFATRSSPATMGPVMAAYSAYSEALAKAGVMTGGAGLLPPATATTLRVKNGQRHVQDGPFADTKEQLGGLYIIDVPDLDTALAWAAKCPAASTTGVEVRPNIPMD
jgi:hypothetical protein